MQELRRVRTGALDEHDNMVSLHDVLDARYQYENENDGMYCIYVCVYTVLPMQNKKQTNIQLTCFCVLCVCDVFFLSVWCEDCAFCMYVCTIGLRLCTDDAFFHSTHTHTYTHTHTHTHAHTYIHTHTYTRAHAHTHTHTHTSHHTSHITHNTSPETYLRRVIMPLETLLVNLKKIIIKDSCVNAVCYGAQLMIPGVLNILFIWFLISLICSHVICYMYILFLSLSVCLFAFLFKSFFIIIALIISIMCCLCSVFLSIHQWKNHSSCLCAHTHTHTHIHTYIYIYIYSLTPHTIL